MSRTHWTSLAVVSAAALSLAGAVHAGDSLLVNGDAETNSMAPWLPEDLVEITTVDTPGTLGLPKGEDIGAFSFHGGFGPTTQGCSQIIDLADHADHIDAGCFQLEFRGLLQSRVIGQASDLITCTFTFLDENLESIGALSYIDPSTSNGSQDWHLFEEIHAAPFGTRSIEVALLMTRQGGSSTDCYADNLTVTIVEPGCPEDLNASGSVDVDDLLLLLGTWGPYDGPCPVDIIDDDVIDVNDLLALLAAWGSC